jgi:hypothetical protein
MAVLTSTTRQHGPTRPASSFASTGYGYEPWHYRYVGWDAAAEVHPSGLPLRQYRWEHER